MNTKATIALLAVAAVMVVGIFAVNMITRPIILDERVRRENDIYFGIVEEASSIEEVTADYQLPEMTSNLFLMSKDDQPYVYVYQTTTKGFSDGLEFLLFVYADTQAVAGIRILNHNETPEYGGKVLDDESYLLQLEEASNEILLSNGIDQVAGASITVRGLQTAIQQVIEYHNDEVVEFVIPDTTPPTVEVLGRNKTFKEGDPAPDFQSYIAASDDNDEAPLISIDSSAVDMSTPGDYTVNVVVSDAAGNQTNTSFVITVVAEEEEIIIVITPPPAERLSVFELRYPNASVFSDVTDQFALSSPVTNIYRVEENGVAIAMVYEATYDAFYADSIVMLTYVTPAGVVEEIQILSNKESRNYGADLIADSSFVELFSNTSISAQPNVDAYTGATITRDAIVDNVRLILEFHQDTFTN
jgi:Na+-translocating ferredoxin:NAD+ oxidoreductase RnfG subunit